MQRTKSIPDFLSGSNAATDTIQRYHAASQPVKALDRLGMLALVKGADCLARPINWVYQRRLQRRVKAIELKHQRWDGGLEIFVSRRSEENNCLNIAKLHNLILKSRSKAIIDYLNAKKRRYCLYILTAEEIARVLNDDPVSTGYAFTEGHFGLVVSDFPTAVLDNEENYNREVASTMMHESAHLMLNVKGAGWKSGRYLEEMICTYLEDVDDTRMLECIGAYSSCGIPLPSEILCLDTGCIEFKLISRVAVEVIVSRMGWEWLFGFCRASIKYDPHSLHRCFVSAGIRSPQELNELVAVYLNDRVESVPPHRLEVFKNLCSMRYSYEVSDFQSTLRAAQALQGTTFRFGALVYVAVALVRLERYTEALTVINGTLAEAVHPNARRRLTLLKAVILDLQGHKAEAKSILSPYYSRERTEYLIEHLSHIALQEPQNLLHKLFVAPYFHGSAQVPRMANHPVHSGG